jgi:hypothetical protein
MERVPTSIRRLNRVSLGALVVGLTLLSSCSKNPSAPSPVSAFTPAGGATSGGDAVAPAPGVEGGKSYLFRVDRPPVAVRPASVKLADLVADISGLGTAGLPSTNGAAAVILVEDSPGTPWGTLLNEAERKIFGAFAADESMGPWLILVSDVVVRDQKDPVPPTGYRWDRKDVQAYVSCGIPASGTNDCKSAFFRAARSVVLAASGYVPRGQ